MLTHDGIEQSDLPYLRECIERGEMINKVFALDLLSTLQETFDELARVRAERDALQRQIEGRAWDHFDPGFVDAPASEDYPGELSSDGPYKQQLRDGRGGWIP